MHGLIGCKKVMVETEVGASWLSRFLGSWTHCGFSYFERRVWIFWHNQFICPIKTFLWAPKRFNNSKEHIYRTTPSTDYALKTLLMVNINSVTSTVLTACSVVALWSGGRWWRRPTQGWPLRIGARGSSAEPWTIVEHGVSASPPQVGRHVFWYWYLP